MAFIDINNIHSELKQVNKDLINTHRYILS